MRKHARTPALSRYAIVASLLMLMNAGCGSQADKDAPSVDETEAHLETEGELAPHVHDPEAQAQMALEASEVGSDSTEDGESEDGLDPELSDRVAATRACQPSLAYYPVRGRHNNGYDRKAGNSKLWTCDNAYSNSDYVRGDHLGNDIWAAAGTPVVATTDGVLRLVGKSRYSGNKVTIEDRCGWYHFNAHLQRIAPGITNGKRVKAGQVIGYVGKTGTASNGVVHLHYSVYPKGNYNRGVDPYPYLKAVEKNTCGTAASTPAPKPAPTPKPATTPDCKVRDDHKLYCKNGKDAAIRAQPRNNSTIVNRMRTTNSWFTCWKRGDNHGNNSTWYYTVGDDNNKWGYVAAANMYTTGTFDANPTAYGLKECD